MRAFGTVPRILAGVLAGLVVAGAAWGFLVEPFRLRAESLTLPCDGLKGPIRIALFSDVAFAGEGRRERDLRDLVTAFQPDLVLVAGDYLNRVADMQDDAILEASHAFLESLPAPSGRFFVPGEEESPEIDRLREAWGDKVEILVNESRRLTIRGDSLDLFGADILVHRIPWPIGRDGDRSYVFSRTFGRREQQRLVYVGEGSEDWRNVEMTVAFMVDDARTFVDFRLSWREGDGGRDGEGWRITRHDFRKDFRAYTNSSMGRQIKGKVTSEFVPPPGVWCRARIRVDDEGIRSRIRARFWREGEPEPESTWAIDATDETPGRRRVGTIALGGRRGERRFADLRVVDDQGRVLLEEDFHDAASVRRRWDSKSALQAWLVDDAGPAGPRVLLAHNPDVVIDVADVGERTAQLVVAGHTHGGQFRIPGFGAVHTATLIGRHYDRGFFHYRGVPLYVSAGVGTSVLPFRLFCPPEVTFITLTPSPPR